MNTSTITFNKDGSVKTSSLNSYIQKGNDNYDEFVISVDDISNSDYQCKMVFTLPNGATNELTGVNYNSGWKITITSAQTTISGSVIASLRIFKTGETLFTYPIYLVINDTGTDEDISETYISAEAINNFQKQLNTYQVKYNINNVRGYLTLALATEDLSNLQEGEIISYVDGSGNIVLAKILNGAITPLSYASAVADEEGNIIHETYATKTEVPSNYQKKLTAGDNIIISDNNVISAVGTGYFIPGNGITISNYQISVNENYVEVKSNKTTVLNASSTDTQYPSAKVVYDDLQNVLEVAEGKTKTYVLLYVATLDLLKEAITKYGSKVYAPDGTDITTSVSNGDYDSLSFNNSYFNSQSASVISVHYLILGGSNFGTATSPILYGDFTLIDITGSHSVIGKKANKGDVFLIVETDVPDRWWNSTSGNFERLETTKVDLTPYFKTSDFASTFTTNIQSVSANVLPSASNTYDLGSSDKTFNYVYLYDGIEIKNTGYTFAILNEGNATYVGLKDYAKLWFGTTSIVANRDIVPSGTRNLGESTNLWNTLYANNLSDGTTTKAVSDIFNTITTTGATSINLKFWKGTQTQYDAITTKDSNTFYIIVE